MRDGKTVRRTYECSRHRNHHRLSEEWCSAMPWSADGVEEYALANVEALLGDPAILARQMEAGKHAEREKLARVAEEAGAEAKSCESLADRATLEFSNAADGDERELLKQAAMLQRKRLGQARARADAALDALNEEPVPQRDPAEVLRDAMREAGGLRDLNAALREAFSEMWLRPGGVEILPVWTWEKLAREVESAPPEFREALREILPTA